MVTFIGFVIFYKPERRTSNASLISQGAWQYFTNLLCYAAFSDVITAVHQSKQIY